MDQASSGRGWHPGRAAAPARPAPPPSAPARGPGGGGAGGGRGAGEGSARPWAEVWANCLLGGAGVFGRGTSHEQLREWLADQFAQNKPYNQVVEGLLTATGKNTDENNGAVN